MRTSRSIEDVKMAAFEIKAKPEPEQLRHYVLRGEGYFEEYASQALITLGSCPRWVTE
jgi:hypothetical protein